MAGDRQDRDGVDWRDRLATIGCAIPIVLIVLTLWVFFALGVFDQIVRFLQTI